MICPETATERSRLRGGAQTTRRVWEVGRRRRRAGRSKSATMITCDRCNTENLEGSQYCDECGAALPGVSARLKKATTGPTEDGETPGSAAFVAPAAPGGNND